MQRAAAVLLCLSSHFSAASDCTAQQPCVDPENHMIDASAGSIGYTAADNSTCSGDDFACWPRAQINLLHTVANVSGCTVVLVGDYHYSDLKVIQPGGGREYAGALQTGRLSKPVYQVSQLPCSTGSKSCCCAVAGQLVVEMLLLKAVCELLLKVLCLLFQFASYRSCCHYIRPAESSALLMLMCQPRLLWCLLVCTQAMASGMTFSTAEHKVLPCEGSFREDLVGLRPGGKCSYVPQPAFGILEVDWDKRVVSLSIRNHTNGDVAVGHDGTQQLILIDLDSCKML